MTQTAEKKEVSMDFLNELVERFEEMRFFAPSELLTRKVIERLQSLSGIDSSGSSEIFQVQQILIAEQFYLYLASISKKPRALNGDSIKIKEIIDFNFDKAIGLAYEAEDRSILDEFTEEFNSWLKDQGGEVNAGWGTINLTSEASITLKRFSTSNEEEIDLLNTAKRSRQPFRGERGQPNPQEIFQELENLEESEVVLEYPGQKKSSQTLQYRNLSAKQKAQ